MSTEECIEMLQSKELVPACPELPNWKLSCEELQSVDPRVDELCREKDPYFPFQTLACVKEENGKVVDSRYFPSATRIKQCEAMGPEWNLTECYCCCFAGGPGGTGEGMRETRAVAPGDSVLAGFLSRPGAGIEWRPLPVSLSEAAPAAEGAALVRLGLGEREVACIESRPLMDESGRLVRAGAVRAGDRLRAADGSALEVESVAREDLDRPVHRITLDSPRLAEDGSAIVDGHLLALDGLVSGDFALELLFDAIPAPGRVESRDGNPLPVA